MVLCREIGRQLIGVMADLVHGIAVLVIAGMGAFDVRYRLRRNRPLGFLSFFRFAMMTLWESALSP